MYAQDPIVKITETVPPIVDNWVNAMQTDDVTFSCQVEQLPIDLKVCFSNLSMFSVLSPKFNVE